MNKFILNPNLPPSPVSAAIIGAGNQKVASVLESYGIRLYTVGNPTAPSVQRHADMLCFHYGGNKLMLARNETTAAEFLSTDGFEISLADIDIASEYPACAGLNCILLNSVFFYGRGVNTALLEAVKPFTVNTITVRQGYVKCNTCVVTSNAVITSDIGLCRIYQSCGLDTLLIAAGGIALPPYEYGFMGGASALIDKDKLLFFGEAEKHPDWEKIKSFCNLRNVDVITIKGMMLTDIGGIIPIEAHC